MAPISSALKISGDGYFNVMKTFEVLGHTEAKDYSLRSPLRSRLRYVAALFSDNPSLAATMLLTISGAQRFVIDDLTEILEGVESEPSLALLRRTYELAREGKSYSHISREIGIAVGATARIERLFGFHQRIDDLVMDAACSAVLDGLSSRQAIAHYPMLGNFKQWNVSRLMSNARKEMKAAGLI
jgi:uncharacterized protein YerC